MASVALRGNNTAALLCVQKQYCGVEELQWVKNTKHCDQFQMWN